MVGRWGGNGMEAWEALDWRRGGDSTAGFGNGINEGTERKKGMSFKRV